MTTTTHAPALRNPSRAACDGFRSRGYKAISADLEKVTCLKCAKILGVTPAAKPVSKNRNGTCQCCFAEQKVSKGGGKLMALHGYLRPGHGYIQGRCRGENEVPFEVSCEQTKVFRQELQEMQAILEKHLSQLMNDEILSLVASVETAEREPGTYHNRMTSMSVARGTPAQQNPHFPTSPWIKIDSFEQLVKKEVSKTEMQIRHLGLDIKTLSEKIDSWVQVWES